MKAIISTSDRTGIVALAKTLVDAGFELVSTGGTGAALREGLALSPWLIKPNEEELAQALQRAALDEFIDGLPDGLDTPVGERGPYLLSPMNSS